MPEKHSHKLQTRAQALSGVAAVVVTFRPDPGAFLALLHALAPQADTLFVIDNSPRDDDAAWEVVAESRIAVDKFRVVRLGENRGIGAALNLGAEIAMLEGAAFILMSDQDSLPSPGMVASLKQLSEELEQDGRRVGAVGPTYTDVHTQRVFPFQTRESVALFYEHRYAAPGCIVNALSLITSGTLIPAHVFRDVGPMNEGLFIDYVDVEWCLRAVSRGYELYGSGAASMFQHLGDRSLRVWYLRWRNETLYSPLRIYYRVRNHITLCRLRYIPLSWKFRASWYVAGVVYSHAIFSDRRMESLAMALKGFAHGLLGRLGRLGEG